MNSERPFSVSEKSLLCRFRGFHLPALIYSCTVLCRSTDVFVLCDLAGLPADTLQGHRDRFEEQFKKYEAPLQSEKHSVTASL